FIFPSYSIFYIYLFDLYLRRLGGVFCLLARAHYYFFIIGGYAYFSFKQGRISRIVFTIGVNVEMRTQDFYYLCVCLNYKGPVSRFFYFKICFAIQCDLSHISLKTCWKCNRSCTVEPNLGAI